MIYFNLLRDFKVLHEVSASKNGHTCLLEIINFLEKLAVNKGVI